MWCCLRLHLGTETFSEMKPTEASHTVTQKLPPTDEAPDIVGKPSPTPVSSSAQSNSSTSLNRQSNSTQSSALTKPPSGVSAISTDTESPQPHITVPPAVPQVDTNTRKEEEPNMEHFEKAAENLVASLDDDEEEEEEEVI